MSRSEKRAMMAEVLSVIANNEIISGSAPPLRHVDFVFLWCEDLEYGVFVTSEFWGFLELFYDAKSSSRTWGEFLNKIGDFGRRFVSIFNEADMLKPRDDDLIEEIQYEVFILDDHEFPITQCADETYNNYVEVLPALGAGREIRTEYGMCIGLYLKSEFLMMKEYMDKTGYAVTSKLFPFITDLHNYR
jgi:hypothetical protein